MTTWEDRGRWPNFGPDEMACQCGCGYGRQVGDVDEGLLDMLEMIRADVDQPVFVRSGARCVQHNEDVGGVDGSAHSPLPDRPACTAADIALGYHHGPYRHRLLGAAFRAGATGVGVAITYVHVDKDHVKPRPAAWTYPTKKPS